MTFASLAAFATHIRTRADDYTHSLEKGRTDRANWVFTSRYSYLRHFLKEAFPHPVLLADVQHWMNVTFSVVPGPRALRKQCQMAGVVLAEAPAKQPAVSVRTSRGKSVSLPRIGNL